MAKFENCDYSKIWDSSEGRQLVTKIYENPDLIKANYNFWAQKMLVDPNITPTDAFGKAQFRSAMREMKTGALMDMRAPLGDSRQADEANLEAYTGSIVDFIAQGFVETAAQREYNEQKFAEFGDAALIAAYATDKLQRFSDSSNMTLSYQTAYLMSTGKNVYKQGELVKGVINKAYIPADNFSKAGTTAWANTPELLDRIREIYNKYLDKWGLDGGFQLEIPKKMFQDVFMKNEQVIEWYRYYKSLNNVLLPESIILTKEMALEAIRNFEGLPEIVIIEEKQKDLTNGIVSGWSPNIAVLRPLGYAGYIRHASILDEKLYSKYGSSAIQRTFAKVNSGLLTIMNTVINNGNLKEWHTDAMMSAVPSLDEFLYHVIIDTATADS